MGGCPTDVISPPKSPNLSVDGGVLEQQDMMVHHTSPRINRLGDRPTSRYNRSSG
jgi:hypothetical protein